MTTCVAKILDVLTRLTAAEAWSLSATGLGCFVDALSLSSFGLDTSTRPELQCLYHFAVGTYVFTHFACHHLSFRPPQQADTTLQPFDYETEILN
jgi:hypothetical protein